MGRMQKWIWVSSTGRVTFRTGSSPLNSDFGSLFVLCTCCTASNGPVSRTLGGDPAVYSIHSRTVVVTSSCFIVAGCCFLLNERCDRQISKVRLSRSEVFLKH